MISQHRKYKGSENLSEGTYILDRTRVAVDKPANDAKVAVSKSDKPVFLAGRRSWVDYRELGVTEATAGAMRAQVIHVKPIEAQPTGWHLHRCDYQFIYVIKGAIFLAFSPDEVIRLGEGDSVMIPGGTIHYEMGENRYAEVFELTLPAEIETENVPNPWGDAEIDFSKARPV